MALRGQRPTMSGSDPAGTEAGTAVGSDDEGFPWYVKVALAATLLVIAFVVVVDVAAVAGAF